VALRLPGGGRARVVLARRGAGGRWVDVRRTGVVRRGPGTAGVVLGRLGPGRYRVRVTVAGEGRTMARTFAVARRR
jgi:hypothetical protein